VPESFVAFSDAVCAFNPAYGQGVTTAALGAQTPGACLAEQRRTHPDDVLTGLAARFQKRLAQVIVDRWLMATSAYYKYEGTRGVLPSPMTKLMNRYVDQVLALCTESEKLYRLFLEMPYMLKPGPALFASPLVWHVLRYALRHRSSTQAAAPEPTLESAYSDYAPLAIRW
jgi:2-polyprenyl-6-methoxyphenol hydroxylase-like FAD-dependent oxidoreductase